MLHVATELNFLPLAFNPVMEQSPHRGTHDWPRHRDRAPVFTLAGFHRYPHLLINLQWVHVSGTWLLLNDFSIASLRHQGKSTGLLPFVHRVVSVKCVRQHNQMNETGSLRELTFKIYLSLHFEITVTSESCHHILYNCKCFYIHSTHALNKCKTSIPFITL